MSRKGRDPEWVHLDKQFPPTKKSSFIDMVPGKYFFMIIGLILIAFVIYVSIHQSEIIINDIDDIDFSDTEFELFNEDNLEEYVPDNKPVNLKIGTDNDWSEFFASDPDENVNCEQDSGSLP